MKQFLICVMLGCIVLSCLAPSSAALSISSASAYTYKKPSSDGIGKVYLGREIAQVMGYQGAEWLERPERIQTEQPLALVKALELNPTDVVAEIGAGTGYISLKLAAKVPQGQVLAVDIQPEMIRQLGDRIAENGLPNVTPILGNEQMPNLPAHSLDLAIFVDSYHELSYPCEVMSAVVQSLKPTGRVALVEYRGEDPFVLIKPHHKMTAAQAKREMNRVGLRWQRTLSALPQQHLMLFTRTDQTLEQEVACNQAGHTVHQK